MNIAITFQMDTASLCMLTRQVHNLVCFSVFHLQSTFQMNFTSLFGTKWYYSSTRKSHCTNLWSADSLQRSNYCASTVLLVHTSLRGVLVSSNTLLRAVTSPAMLYARNVSPYASERDVREVSILTGNYIIDIILVTTLINKAIQATTAMGYVWDWFHTKSSLDLGLTLPSLNQIGNLQSHRACQ